MSQADRQIRLKRLRFRSWHRGCKETDLILGQFAETGMSQLADDTLERYEALLEEHDADIWNWLTEKTAPPAEYASLIDILRTVKPATA